jgi:VanZ family protein
MALAYSSRVSLIQQGARDFSIAPPGECLALAGCLRTIVHVRITTYAAQPWHLRASPLARTAAFVYALLLVYSGLAPWSGWRDLGLSPLAYLTAPAPHYITTFDLVVNVLAYMPLGALVVFALHPRLRGAGAVLAAAVIGVLLSATIEALQSYLPMRVASNLDLLTNSGGALLGAALAAPFTSSVIDRGRLADWRLRWFERRSSSLLMLVALWPAAQIYPGRTLFGNGEIHRVLSDLATALGGHWPRIDTASFGPAEFVLAEAFIVAAALLAVGLGFASGMQRNAPRGKLLLALLLAALAAKSLSSAIHFGPERALAWLTPGAYGGLALGLLSLLAAIHGRTSWLPKMAFVALLALILAVNLVPDNPYHQATMQQWRQGALLNFNALANWLSVLWPYLLALWLLGKLGQQRADEPHL